MHRISFFLLKSDWILLGIVASIFLVGFVDGMYVSDQLSKSEDLNTATGVMHLIVNNLLVCALIGAGFFTFGLTSIIYLFSNGMILGESISNKADYSSLEILLLIMPHGIFEIPALLLSGVIGFKSISFIIQFFTQKRLNHFLKGYFSNLARLCLLVILLVIIAGFIETYLTPLFEIERMQK